MDEIAQVNHSSWGLLIFIVLAIALIWAIHKLQSIIKKRETAEFHRKEFEKWKDSASNDLHFIHRMFQKLNDLYDFDRAAFEGEDGSDAVDTIIEKLDEFKGVIDSMSDCARTHEQFRMVSDVTYVHSALRSAMTHYSRGQ